MDNSNTDMANGCTEENTNLLLPSDNMLNKLRCCDIIPRNQHDFQIFVRGLTGDISDTVIEEVWRQIFRNETTGVARPVSFSPEIASKSCKSVCSRTAKTSNRKSLPMPLDSTSGKVKKRKHSSYSAVEISKEEVSQDTEINNMAAHGVADAGSTLKEFIVPVKCDYSEVRDSQSNELSSRKVKTRHASCSVTSTPKQEKRLSSRKVKTRHASCSVTSTPKQEKRLYTEIDNVTPDKTKENSSSDCEIIEVVSSSTRRNSLSSDNSDSESDKSDSSGSDSSVEILESSNSTEQSREEDICPVHGSDDISKSENSWERSANQSKISNDTDKQKYFDDTSKTYSTSGNKTQQKDKRGKKAKYETLRYEVKCLKSLLVNVLISLKNSPGNEYLERKKKMPSQSKEELNNLVKNSQNRKDSGSFSRKNSRMKETKSKTKLKPSTFVGTNKAGKTTKSHKMKQQRAKYSDDDDDDDDDDDNDDDDDETNESLEKMFGVDSCDIDNGKRKKFLWRNIITDTLKSKPEMKLPVEKLKRIVVAKYYYYRGNVSQNTSLKFLRYLHSTAGVFVEGDVARYTDKQIIKISSKSEQKKQVIVKTVKTTKQYKMS